MWLSQKKTRGRSLIASPALAISGKPTGGPVGHEYRDWQEPRIRTRVACFHFHPPLGINADQSVTELAFSPRLFFEDNRLWDVAFGDIHRRRRFSPSALLRSPGRTDGT